MKHSSDTPPKWPLQLLRWVIRNNYLEEIEGDMEELFQEYLDQYSARKARRRYAWDTLKLLRPSLLKNVPSLSPIIQTNMLRHNLLITYRNFLRNKSSFLINLLGLSTGLTCVLLIYLWVSDELSVDSFHEQNDRLFQVMERAQHQEGPTVTPYTAGLLSEALSGAFPEVEFAVASRGIQELQTLSVGEKHIRAVLHYVDSDFFQIFSFAMLAGNPKEILKDPGSMVISEDLAMRLFGSTQSVIGKIVEFQHEKQYQISGIFRNLPNNSSLQFDFVLPFKEYMSANQLTQNWGYNTTINYLLLAEGANPATFSQKISGLVESVTGQTDRSLFLQPFADGYLYGKYENGVQAGGRISYVRLFSLIALFILLIACINFMNLSTARASKKFKEIGVKKVLGASKSSLIKQYLGESILLVSISLCIGLAFTVLLLPLFNSLTAKTLTLTLNTEILVACLGITLLTGILAGSYPALYLSRFNPLVVLKGKLGRSYSETWARKGLVVLQFSLSIIFLVAVFVIYQQLQYIQNKNLGYNKENIFYLNIEGKLDDNLETFLAEVKKLPGIQDASSIGQEIVGSQNSLTDVNWDGKNPDEVVRFEWRPVNFGMIDMLGIKMADGRTFSREFGEEDTKIIVNETAIEVMGLQNPLGKSLRLGNLRFEIIGVTEDFHVESLHEGISPLFFVFRPNWTHKVMVKAESGSEREAIERLQSLYESFNPGFSFDYRFVDQDFQAQYISEQKVSTLSRYFAGLAVLISCLGLFGLAAFTAERRLKEIGVRKVLGASAWHITHMLSTDFTRLVLLAIAIALPISYLISQQWLDEFAYKIGLKWWYFAGAAGAALLIAWLTVSYQTFKAARINPAECLRDE